MSPRKDHRATGEIGRVFGSYKIISTLGEGGMGVVYLVQHTRLGRQVALKRLKSRYASDREAVKRFVAEAWAIGQIHHPNIVQVSDFVLGENDVYYIMELLEGRTLAKELLEHGVTTPQRALRIAIQIADALSAVHLKNFVHGDIKPSNIFLTKADDDDVTVKLLDFGIARLLKSDGPGPEDTGRGRQLMTPVFMSPEQAEHRAVDGRSDLYSLGAVLYQMLTGRPPFEAATFAEYVYKHTQVVPEPVRPTAPDTQSISPAFATVVEKCLQKRPEDRFQSAELLRQALLAIADPADQTADPGDRSESSRSGWPWIAVGLGLALCIGLLAVILPDRGAGDLAPKPRHPRRLRGPSRAAPPDAATARRAPQPEILLRIKTRPSRALVRRVHPDPAILGLTPLLLRVVPSQTAWTVDVTKTGHRQVSLTIPIHRDVSRWLDLEPAPPTAVAPRPMTGRWPMVRRPPPMPRPVDPMGIIDPFGGRGTDAGTDAGNGASTDAGSGAGTRP